MTFHLGRPDGKALARGLIFNALPENSGPTTKHSKLYPSLANTCTQ